MFNPRVLRVVAIAAVLLTLTFWLFSNAEVTTSYMMPQTAPQQQADPLMCTKSWDGIKPVQQYVVMIDAGSSGSRVHVYEFNNCQEVPQLVHEEFKMMKPGLSSFDTDTEGAAKSLDELLDVALATVPKDKQACSPVAVKATAGLRMLGDEKSANILAAVRSRLENSYPFPVVEGDGVSIMEGTDEGVYAWVTANYLLGNIGKKEKTPTAAVFDLGGGSTQIVFEPSFNVPGKIMPEGDHKYTLDFGGRHFELYQHSHLGYGLNEARKQINAMVVENSGKEVQSGMSVTNPCYPPNVSSEEEVVLKDKQSVTVKMVGPKEASSAQCRKIAEDILNKDGECTMAPCSFNGVHQPSLVESFLRDSDLYTFSFFYDRTFPLGMPSSFSLDELKELTNKVCKGKAAHDSFGAISGAVKELEDNPHWCLELNYMTAILHTGYDIPINREVKIAKKIKNTELGWCLGASLPLLDASNWSCRRQV